MNYRFTMLLLALWGLLPAFAQEEGVAPAKEGVGAAVREEAGAEVPEKDRAAAPEEEPATPPEVEQVVPAVTPLELRYDADQDGILSLPEIKTLLEDRMALAKLAGAVIIASGVEQRVDLDEDGILVPQEIERALKIVSGEQVARYRGRITAP